MADSDSDASLESVDVALADFVERARARVGRGEVKLAPTVDEAPARRSMSPERSVGPTGEARAEAEQAPTSRRCDAAINPARVCAARPL